MKTSRSKLNGSILCIAEILVGILLLIDPVGFTTGIIMAAGIVLMVVGLISVIRYFRAERTEAMVGQYLLKGLAALLAGAFCTFKTDWFLVTFPAITILYGIVVLVTGLGKIQLSVDMIRDKRKKWGFAVISAVLSVACGIVILSDPFVSTAVLWMFTGITLIIESVVDLITLIVSGREEARAEKEA